MFWGEIAIDSQNQKRIYLLFFSGGGRSPHFWRKLFLIHSFVGDIALLFFMARALFERQRVMWRTIKMRPELFWSSFSAVLDKQPVWESDKYKFGEIMIHQKWCNVATSLAINKHLKNFPTQKWLTCIILPTTHLAPSYDRRSGESYLHLPMLAKGASLPRHHPALQRHQPHHQHHHRHRVPPHGFTAEACTCYMSSTDYQKFLMIASQSRWYHMLPVVGSEWGSGCHWIWLSQDVSWCSWCSLVLVCLVDALLPDVLLCVWLCVLLCVW